MEISKSLYVSELNRLLGPNSQKSIFDKFIKAYDFYEKLKYTDIDSIQATILVNNLLEYLFKGKYPDFSIPISFINSPIGTVLFTLRFGIKQLEFTTTQIEEMLGISRALVSYDKKHGNLVALTKGRDIFVSFNNLIEYAKSKGILEHVIISNINAYLERTKQ